MAGTSAPGCPNDKQDPDGRCTRRRERGRVRRSENGQESAREVLRGVRDQFKGFEGT